MTKTEQNAEVQAWIEATVERLRAGAA